MKDLYLYFVLKSSESLEICVQLNKKSFSKILIFKRCKMISRINYYNGKNAVDLAIQFPKISILQHLAIKKTVRQRGS